MNDASILLPCGIDGCKNIVKWIYDPGEPQTYEQPGSPDFWIPQSGCLETKRIDDINPYTKEIMQSIDVYHVDLLVDNDEFQSRCDRIACESWDNDLWYCDYSIPESLIS